MYKVFPTFPESLGIIHGTRFGLFSVSLALTILPGYGLVIQNDCDTHKSRGFLGVSLQEAAYCFGLGSQELNSH